MKSGTRWGWGVALLAMAGMGLLLSFMLPLLQQGPLDIDRHFLWLFWVNVLVAMALAGTLVFIVGRIWLRMRRGFFGTKLLLKLAGIFALVGVLPGALIYTVSYQFVSSSIEAWFDEKVERALDAGLALGKGTLEALNSDFTAKTRTAAARIGEVSSVDTLMTLERLREQMGMESLTLLDHHGTPVVSTLTQTDWAVDRPQAQLLKQARQARVATHIEGLDDESLAPENIQGRLRGVAPVPSTRLSLRADDVRYLMTVQALPRALTGNALLVQAAYREYQQRDLARDGLRRMYTGTLTLSLALSVFAAVALAVVLGRELVRPLLLLAEGMRQVARGDLGAKPVFASRDELGGLTRSFALMTEQLGSAREQAERSLRELERARTWLQTILDNLTAGVIVFDAWQRVDTVNPGAARILRVPLNDWTGHDWAERPELADFARMIWQRFDAELQQSDVGEPTTWQDSLQLPVTGSLDHHLTLLVRGAVLPGGARLVVFDDITEVVSAQRSEAWAEVARRVAHEIKNPLTPIQLSAERMQHKLEAKLEGPDQAMLVRSVATIVTQVQAMKKLVNEFRDFARLPPARMQPLDLNALVQEVLGLYGEAQERGRLQVQYGAPLPPIPGDATQLRQVIHNLVQNALEAIEDQAHGSVSVCTELAPSEGSGVRVRLKVTDNGPGFSDKVLKRAFEPYITTKSKGTGLGLAVVKKIAEEHGARVRLTNLPAAGGADGVSGASVSLSFPSFTEQRTPPASEPPPLAVV
ncbi:Histidine kinase [Vitreoscilla filiformis]|uniref:histidine kinase n=1 Tax=Vitreoscilla filiformis TaxID=63 RepID=A0A221KC09_VITFI|nr:ATP-binding protein [Vitreoscilla filiformis]ASM76343.1 Histidine kinase [Vitreoscilla filiformis]